MKFSNLTSKSSSSKTPVEVIASHLTFKVKDKVIIDDVSFLAKPNQIFTIVGTANSGKTTILKCIERHQKYNQQGEVFLNGHPADSQRIKKYATCISSHEQLLAYLTVYETFMFTAKLQLPHLSQKDREVRVQHLIDDLQLNSCQHTLIGNEWRKTLSAGEKKKVQLGLAVLDDRKSIIIADEALSSLDSSSYLKIFSFLKNLASQQRTIIMTMNGLPPYIMPLLDQVMFLADGRPFYIGEAQDVVKYLSAQGLACPKVYDIGEYMVSLPMRSTDELNINVHDRLEQSAHHQEMLLDIEQRSQKTKPLPSCPRTSPLPSIYKIPTLTRLLFLNSIRSPIAMIVLLLTQISHSVIMGGIFWKINRVTGFRNHITYDAGHILHHPLLQLVMYGSKETPPLYDFFENQINRTINVMDLMLSKPQWIVDTYNLLSCGLPHLNSYLTPYYDTFGTRPIQPDSIKPAQTLSDINPSIALGTVVGILQYLDYLAAKSDWSQLKSFLNDGPTFYAMLMLQYDGLLLDPWMYCLDYPLLRPEKIEGRSTRINKRRQLIELIDADYQALLNDFLGLGGYDLYKTFESQYKAIEQCSHTGCQWIKNTTSTVQNLTRDYYDSVMTLITIITAYFICCATLGFSSYDSLLTFPQQKVYIYQEVNHDRFTIGTFFLAKNIAEFPFQLIPCLITTSIFCFMANLTISFPQYINYILIAACTTFAAFGFGYCISALTPRLEIAVIIAPILLIAWLLTAGFVMRAEYLPTAFVWFGHVGFYKWSYFGFILNHFSSDSGYFGAFPNTAVLTISGTLNIPIYLCILALILLGIVYRCIAYCGLRFIRCYSFKS